MKKLPILVLLVVLSFISGSAQSGRKIQPTPTPLPKAESPDDYSESASQARRPLIRPQLRGVPSSDQSVPSTTGTPSSVQGEDIIKVETDLVTIPVSVFDRNGLYIPGLLQKDFKIYEDGKEQEIAYFGTSDKPFTVVLLIDVSPSTEYRIEEIQRAATAFVDQLKPQNRVMVIEFAASVHVLTEPTNDREQIYKAIRKTGFGDGTSLYEAVHLTIAKRLNGIEGRKAVVLFTDGVDTTSRKATYDSTLDEAEESDALIFPIYYNTLFDVQRQGGGGNIGFPPTIMGMPQIYNRGVAADYAVGKKYLDELATYTGGRVFRPESTPGGLTRAFEGIAEELRRQYNIGFVPKEEGKAGQRKQIKVRVNRPNLVVRSRDSYIVGSKSAPVAASPGK
jgi:Ca-activated chloride channel homolog